MSERELGKFNLTGKERPFGVGTERTVYQDPANPERVIGIYHEDNEQTPNQLKARFYLTKILRLLFPKNIPETYLVSSQPKAIVQEKADLDEIHSADREREVAKYLNERQPVTGIDLTPHTMVYPHEVHEFAEKFLELGVNLDADESNLGYDKEGNIIFVDPVPAYFIPPIKKKPIIYNFDSNKLESAVKELDEEASRIGLDYLRRLKQICINEEAMRNKK